MRIFTKEELIGEWSNPIWRFRLFENGNLNLQWLELKSEVKGTYQIFENFLIFDYGPIYRKGQWTARIETLDKNNLELTDLPNTVGQLEHLKKSFFEKDLIKQFDFEQLKGLKIQEVKKKLDINTLNLITVKTLDGEDTGYMRHWDSEGRVAVIIKKDLLEKIKHNGMKLLAVNKSFKEAAIGYYTNFVISEYVEPKKSDEVDSSNLNIQVFADLVKNSNNEAIIHEQRIGKLNHYLLCYNEGDFNGKQIVLVTLKNKIEIRKYIIPLESQLELRAQYYWINGIKDFLEEDLLQKRLVILEDYTEIKLKNENYFINKILL